MVENYEEKLAWLSEQGWEIAYDTSTEIYTFTKEGRTDVRSYVRYGWLSKYISLEEFKTLMNDEKDGIKKVLTALVMDEEDGNEI